MYAIVLVDTKVSYDRSHSNAKEVNAMVALARTFIHRHTLVWGTDGVRALPALMWEDFDKEVESFKQDIQAKGGFLQVFYLPYPFNNYEYILEKDNATLMNLLTAELIRRCNLMERDALTRIEQLVHDLKQRLEPDFVNGAAKLRRFHEETIHGLPYEVDLFRKFNNVLKNNVLDNILDGVAELAQYDVKDIRKDAATRHEAWQKTVDLVKLLSNA
jgi:hypothetical protein